jgi:hypothetical protein
MKKSNLEKGSYAPLYWFLAIVVGFWVLWYYTGGPERANTQAGPFMHPLAPLGNGQGYNSNGQ